MRWASTSKDRITLKQRTKIDKIQSIICHYENQNDSTSANGEDSDDEMTPARAILGMNMRSLMRLSRKIQK